MQRRVLIILFISVMSVRLQAQQADKVLLYIEQYKDIAMDEMKRTGVPAAITLAQGIHESGIGEGRLAVEANNHFGIKCKSNWTGESIKHDDDARGECFRKYPSAGDSYKDHSDFLKNSPRYAFLFQLSPTDYAAWANGLKSAGYATNPKYPQVLIKLIEDYRLQDYTLLALGRQPGPSADTTKEGTGKTEQSPAMVSTATAGTATERKAAAEISAVYPSGEFRINETRVVFIKKGTSFLSVAQQYNIELAKLFDINELPVTETSSKDQLIYLQRKRKTGSNSYHIVQEGETLHDIAQAEAIRLESLLSLNWLEDGMQPAIGEKLSLQNKSATIPRLALKNNYSVLPAIPKKGI